MKKPNLSAIRSTLSEAARMAIVAPVRTDEQIARSRSFTRRLAKGLLMAMGAYAVCCAILVVGLAIVFGTVNA